MNTWTILTDGSAQSSDGTTMSSEQVQEFAAKYLEWYGEPPKMTGFFISQNGTLLSRTGANWGWERYVLSVGWVRWASGKYETHDWDLVLYELQALGKDTLPLKLVTRKLLANFAQSPTEKGVFLVDGSKEPSHEPEACDPYATRNGDVLWKTTNGYWERYSFEDSGDYEREIGGWEKLCAGDDFPVKRLSKQLFATPV